MKVAHFYCYGGIGNGEGKISSLTVSKFLNSLPPEVEEVCVHISSYGGNVFEGYAIHDLLKNCGKKVTTIAEGPVMSIATMVLLSGEKRIIYPNATVMTHLPKVIMEEGEEYRSKELIELGSDMKEEEVKMIAFYCDKTGLDEETVKGLCAKDTYLTADKALELKFVTEIGAPIKAVAEYTKPKSKNDTDMSEKKNKFLQFLAETKSKINEIFGEETPAVKAESASTSDGTVMYFEGTLAEGTMVFSDEAMTTATPDGSYTMPDESTVEVAGGAVTSITAKATAAVTPEDEIKALKEENEKLKADLNAKTSELTSVETESTKVVSDLTARLTKIKSEYVPKTSTTQFQSKETATTKEQMQKEVEEKKAKMEELLSKK